MNQPIETPKPKDMLPYLLVVLLITILGAAAYWYFVIRNSTPTTSQSTTTSKPSSTTTNTTSTPSTATTTSTTSTEKTKVKIFMIAESDNGKTGKLIGCGDSAVAVEKEVPKTEAVLKAALEELLSIKAATYGESGLSNPLSKSNLTLDSVSIDNGKATIKLSGQLVSAGDCEDPRIQAQIEETALQFSTVQTVEITVNGKTLKELFSQEGA